MNNPIAAALESASIIEDFLCFQGASVEIVHHGERYSREFDRFFQRLMLGTSLINGLGILFGLGIPARKYVIIMQTRRCASSVQMIQYGESPNPAKRSEQPVLSLGARTVR